MVPVSLVYACFFLSGLSALIYEVAWLNRIQLVMGHTVYSLATTIAAYMIGLAAGALLLPRVRRLAKRVGGADASLGLGSLKLYLLAELSIGLYGLAFHPLLAALQIPYGALVTRFQLSLPILSVLQFCFCGLLIFLPTLLMGMTLPLLADYLHSRGEDISERIPGLYGVNTLGAASGSWLAGFLILPSLGYTRTIYLAAIVNMLIFILATLFYGGRISGESVARPEPEAAPTLRQALGAEDVAACWILFVSGLASMVAQVTWNRLAALGFGPSVYVFPSVTTVVLLGMGLGSLAYDRLGRELRSSGRVLIFLPTAAALAYLAGNYALTRAPLFVLYIHSYHKPGFWALTALGMLWLCLCLLPAAALQGSLFPAAIAAITRRKGAAAPRALAVGYALNIAGLVVGALAGSFWLLPWLGIERLSDLLFLLLIATSAGLALSAEWVPQVAACVWAMGWIALHVLPPYDWNVLTSGYFYNRTKIPDDDKMREAGFLGLTTYADTLKTSPVIAHHDDPHATISIHRLQTNTAYRLFRVNGKVDGNNREDLVTTRIVALLPLLARPDAESALTIGLGTGSTVVETLKSYPKMRTSKVVELSPSMIRYAREYFPDVSGPLWTDPRFEAINRDGRDFLEHSPDQFDLIISEPSNPWVDGVGSLFTTEYYKSVARRLTPTGVASLWFHTYGLDCDAVKSVLGAAGEAFETVYVFYVGKDIFMLAGGKGLKLQAIPRELSQAEVDLFEMGNALVSTGRRDRYTAFLQNNLFFERPALEQMTSFSERNHDDNQYLQYSSGRSFAQRVDCNLSVFGSYKRGDLATFVAKMVDGFHIAD
jgi:spermidine synthase